MRPSDVLTNYYVFLLLKNLTKKQTGSWYTKELFIHNVNEHKKNDLIRSEKNAPKYIADVRFPNCL